MGFGIRVRRWVLAAVALGLVACGGGGGGADGQAYTVGGSVSGLTGAGLVLRNNGGDDLPIDADGDFTFATPIADGAGYAVAVKHHPAGQNCVVANGSGTIAGAAVENVAITCSALVEGPASRFLYVANGNDISHSVAQYAVGETGALSALTPATVDSGKNGGFISVHPSGAWLYAANPGDGGITQFAIGSDGALSSVGTAEASPYPWGVIFHPSGDFAYVPIAQDIWGNSVKVELYGVAADGALTHVASGTQATGANLRVTIDPSGDHAYTVNGNDGTITAYAIGGSGAWSPIGSILAHDTLGFGAQAMVIDASDKFAYVLSPLNNWGRRFTIGSDGALTAAGSLDVGEFNPISIALDPHGRYAYVARYGGEWLYQYLLESDGSLTANGSVYVGNHVNFVTVDPSGKYLYASQELASAVLQFTIGGDGTLEEMTPSYVATGGFLPKTIVVVASNP